MEDQRKLKANGAKLRTFGADLTPSGHRQELLHHWAGSRAVASRFLARRPSLTWLWQCQGLFWRVRSGERGNVSFSVSPSVPNSYPSKK